MVIRKELLTSFGIKYKRFHPYPKYTLVHRYIFAAFVSKIL